MSRQLKAPKHLSKNQQQKYLKEVHRERLGAAQRGQVRFDEYQGNYVKLTFDDIKKNIAGFGRIGGVAVNENNAKFIRHTTTGWQIIMDLSRTYFRIQNAREQYTDQLGRPQGTRTLNEFMAVSHFKTK